MPINRNTVNWKKLATWIPKVEAIPCDHFDMLHYREEENNNPICETSGCVLGHMTEHATCALPLKLNAELEPIIDFNNFAYTEVGITHQSRLWRYLFSSDWAWEDDTPRKAADRIRKAVEHQYDQEAFDWYMLIDDDRTARSIASIARGHYDHLLQHYQDARESEH